MAEGGEYQRGAEKRVEQPEASDPGGCTFPSWSVRREHTDLRDLLIRDPGDNADTSARGGN
jgi:hypothetical protein